MWNKEGSLPIHLQRNGKNGSESFVLSTPRQKCRVKEQQNIQSSGNFFEQAQWWKRRNYASRFFSQQHPANPKPYSKSSEHMRLSKCTIWKLAPNSFEDIKLSCIGMEFENFWAPLRASMADTDTRHLLYSERHCTHKVTLRRVRATTVAVKKPISVNIFWMCL